MPSKLDNALPLFIHVWKWVVLLFTSGLLDLILLKVKKVGMSHRVKFTS